MSWFFRDGDVTKLGRVVGISLDLGVMATIIYIAIHFMRKYW